MYLAMHALADLSLYIYILLIILPTLLLAVLLRPKSGGSNIKALPGSSGWPLIGETIRFSSRPQIFFSDRLKKYSKDVFQTSLFRKKMAVFGGAQGNKFVYSKLTTSWWPESMGKFFHFPGLRTDIGINPVSLFMQPEALKQYIPVMDAVALEHVKSEWDGNDAVKVLPLAKKYMMNIAFRLFVKVVHVEHVDMLIKNIKLVNTGIFSFPINLPGTAFYKGAKAGKMIRDELLKIVSNRRKEMMERKETSSSFTDFASRLFLAKDVNGNGMSDKEICNIIVGLLLGSQDSTSTNATFVLKYLAEFPCIYDKVHTEVMEIAQFKKEGEFLTWTDVQKMRYTWNVVRETLRLATPGFGGFREVVNDVSFAGFTIPKGWKICWSMQTTHRNPEYFHDPEKFDPSRFEGTGPAPYTFVPFGGGTAMCPGKEYARLKILVFIYNIVTRYRLEMINPDEKITFALFPAPEEGLPLRIIPHAK